MRPLNKRLYGLILTVVITLDCAKQPLKFPAEVDCLSPEEVRRVTSVLRLAHLVNSDSIYAFLGLEEPPKRLTLDERLPSRAALAVIYDPTINTTVSSSVDLNTWRVTSFKRFVGVPPHLFSRDEMVVSRLVRRDPRWIEAMRRRGLKNLSELNLAVTPSAVSGIHRTVKVLTNVPALFGSRPIDGVVVSVDLTINRVVSVLDLGVTAIPPSTEMVTHQSDLGSWSGTQTKNYVIVGSQVTWRNWRFGISFVPREGMVIRSASYLEAGKRRSILHRGSLSEIVVPYADPNPEWSFLSGLDLGELGASASSMSPGQDCPLNSTTMDVTVVNEQGEPQILKRAVVIYEREAGVAWKYGHIAHPANELVVLWNCKAGNYEYGIEWAFKQDGAIRIRVLLSGVMLVKGGSERMFGRMVTPDLSAIHHQHFFCFRLDLDVDGPENRVSEVNVEPTGGGPGYFHGGFAPTENILLSATGRTVNPNTSRFWKIENPVTGTAYSLIPFQNVSPMNRQSVMVRRAGFLKAHFWVTPYEAGQLYAGTEDGPQGNQGLEAWVGSKQSIVDRDIVVWYTLGLTHITRPEDWPTMPTQEADFALVPSGFFRSNPTY